MTRIFDAGHFLFTCGLLIGATFLSTRAQGHHSDQNCVPATVAQCFESYRVSLFSVIYIPEDDVTIRTRIQPEICSTLEKKSPCHKNFELCPNAVIANFTSQEKGYEEVRRIACDEKAYMDFVIARTCVDVKKQAACEIEKMLSSVRPGDVFEIKASECRNWGVQATCYERSFTPPCLVAKATAISAIKAGYTAAALLTGCDDPNGAGTLTVSLGTVTILFALGLFHWTRA